jgi:hypothetical protein
MAVIKGGKGLEGYVAEWPVILPCVLFTGLIGAILGLVAGPLKHHDKSKPMP